MRAAAVALTIAGSDNSAGAGIQADLKAISHQKVYALTAVTCVVAEAPGVVSMIQPVRPAVLREQIRIAFDAFPVGAVKTGMLYSRRLVDAVAAELKNVAALPPLVIDPVMVASSGDALLQPDAVRSYFKRLFPLAALVTPNTDELALLTGRRIRSPERMVEAGREIAAATGAAFLLKGGHLRGGEALDVLVTPDGKTEEFTAPFIKGRDPHGTGCTYSAAITAFLARGETLPCAVGQAKTYITRCIRDELRWGRTAVLNHFP